jgi:hypothetical protein
VTAASALDKILSEAVRRLSALLGGLPVAVIVALLERIVVAAVFIGGGALLVVGTT